MKQITYFYLKSCPYCRQADLMIQELIRQEPKYSVISIQKIEEQEQADIADRYDYYFVPCLFVGQKKLMEGIPTPEKLRNVFSVAFTES